MTPPIDAPQAISYSLPIVHEPLNRLVSEIFSIKVAHKRTHRQTDTSTDNKGRLKLVASEPIKISMIQGSGREQTSTVYSTKQHGALK